MFHTALLYFEDIIKGEKTAHHYKRLKRLTHADPEFLHDYRLKALKNLLKHAYTYVPYYKKKFDELGVKPEDIKSFADFSKLPALTREDVKSHRDDLISKKHDRSQLKSGYTSGSSGTPMTFYYDKLSYSAGKAALLIGWELAGKRMGDRVITVWGGRDTVTKKWTKPGSRLKAKLYRNTRIPAFLLKEESRIAEAIDVMKQQKGGYIYGYTNAIYTIASYAKEHNIHFEPKFDGILTTAENLFPHQRKVVEEVFGQVYDGYGCREIHGIAFQCREKKGYHIIEPSVIVETESFVDGNSEIIATDLWNYAWPLIRYKTGDLVSGKKGQCTCGCTWTTIKKIEGRSTDVLTAPDGTLIYYILWLIVEIFDYFPIVKQFQWAKVARDKLVLRLLLYEEPYKDLESKTFLKSKILKHFGPHFKDIIQFDVEFVDEFEIGPTGKHKVIIDEIK
jgi:phenylacetate-CoA ligase